MRRGSARPRWAPWAAAALAAAAGCHGLPHPPMSTPAGRCFGVPGDQVAFELWQRCDGCALPSSAWTCPAFRLTIARSGEGLYSSREGMTSDCVRVRPERLAALEALLRGPWVTAPRGALERSNGCKRDLLPTPGGPPHEWHSLSDELRSELGAVVEAIDPGLPDFQMRSPASRLDPGGEGSNR